MQARSRWLPCLRWGGSAPKADKWNVQNPPVADVRHRQVVDSSATLGPPYWDLDDLALVLRAGSEVLRQTQGPVPQAGVSGRSRVAVFKCAKAAYPTSQKGLTGTNVGARRLALGRVVTAWPGYPCRGR